MKLHIPKNWIDKFEHDTTSNDDLGAGIGLGEEAILSAEEESYKDIDWRKFPIGEMNKLGWINVNKTKIKTKIELISKAFFELLNTNNSISFNVFCRRSFHESSKKKMDHYALLAWAAQVLITSSAQHGLLNYENGIVTKEFMQNLSKFSLLPDGPLLAQEELANNGISLVFVPHLTHTYLDGGVLLSNTGNPVIGLTLRHDRIDNFWFTLFHELAHIVKHLDNQDTCFVDDTVNKFERNDIEKQADNLAREALIPKSIWRGSRVKVLRSYSSIIELSKEISIHPAIIAGRLRFDTNDYSLFDDLLGRGEIRKLFQES